MLINSQCRLLNTLHQYNQYIATLLGCLNNKTIFYHNIDCNKAKNLLVIWELNCSQKSQKKENFSYKNFSKKLKNHLASSTF